MIAMPPQRAFTSFETLVCLLISAPLMLCALVLLTSACRAHVKLNSVERKVDAVSRIHALLTQALHALDSAPFDFTPRLHLAGRITFSDGTDNPVMHGSALHRPHPAGDAFTALRLDLKNSFSVHAAAWSGAHLTLDACPRFGFAPAGFDDYRSYLVLSIDRFFEAVPAAAPAEISPARCRRFDLQAQRSMAAETSPPGGVPLVLMPVCDLWTIYVDRERTLRYLSHAGARNIENQPLMARGPLLSLFLPGDPQRRIIDAVLHFSGGHTEHVAAVPFLPPRGTRFNFLLNF